MVNKSFLMLLVGLMMSGCQHLSPSYQYSLPSGDKVYSCDRSSSLPPFTQALTFSSKYGKSDIRNNAGRDQLDSEWSAKYAAQTKNIRLFERSLSKISIAYTSGKYSASSLANCMLETLSPWAESGALLGEAGNHTGKSVRKWSLAAITSNYLAVEAAINLEDTRAKLIKQWIDELTVLTINEWSHRPDSKVNNHDYWAAWAVLNSAIILNRYDYYHWSLNVFQHAMLQLNQEGLLPNELKRNSKALSYHNYALIPLVMIADIAYANGDDFISSPLAPINNLVANVTLGLVNPIDFMNLSGLVSLPEQTTTGLYSSYSLAWIPVYLKYHNNKQLENFERQYSPFKSSRLGGDVSSQIENAIR